ncbi:MAG TPA: hypothetical protein PLQ57_11720 [Saprospiraceae bacterium]|nr:hypothetical protein [Saprospiraceae bacterium]
MNKFSVKIILLIFAHNITFVISWKLINYEAALLVQTLIPVYNYEDLIKNYDILIAVSREQLTVGGKPFAVSG